MKQGIEDATLRQLSDALWRASRQAEVVASNLANVDTPGYRALQVQFQETLADLRGQEMSRTDARHLGSDGPSARAIVSEAPWDRMRTDGNTVDIDREMTRLAKVQGKFSTAAQLVRKRFGLLRYAATDGRG